MLERRLGRLTKRVADIVARAWTEGREIEVYVREKIATNSGVQEASPEVHGVVRALDGQERFDDEQAQDMEQCHALRSVLPLDALADDEKDRGDCPGTTGDGEWLKIRNGITIDSGSAAWVMPTSWFPGLTLSPSHGSKRGQKFVGGGGGGGGRRAKRRHTRAKISWSFARQQDKTVPVHCNAQMSTRCWHASPAWQTARRTDLKT